MSTYGQYCPVAKAAEVLGDRWTLLILRDMHTGALNFNDLHRGLPGISRSVLTQRLRKLERDGLIDRELDGRGRTERYGLTEAGSDLQEVLTSMSNWVSRWVMDDPTPAEMDPRLLMLWFSRVADLSTLGEERFVAQFDLSGPVALRSWIVLADREVSLCFDDPCVNVDIWITANTGILYQVFTKRLTVAGAVSDDLIRIRGSQPLARSFLRLVSEMAPQYMIESASSTS